MHHLTALSRLARNAQQIQTQKEAALMKREEPVRLIWMISELSHCEYDPSVYGETGLRVVADSARKS